jgi:sporadic carbohydrate cluster 2OG-Fe(II) oxygenase
LSHNNNYWGFLDNEEISRGKEFIDKGYVISDVSSTDGLERLREAIVECARNLLGIAEGSTIDFLNSFHNYVPKDDLNRIRLHLIKEINAKDWVRQEYWKIASLLLNTIVGNELAMQLRINLSIQLPNDDNSHLTTRRHVPAGENYHHLVTGYLS